MSTETTPKLDRAGKIKPITSVLAVMLMAAGARASEILVPEDYPTIQAALDVAVAGDTVSVAPGIYPENVRFTTDGVTLLSRVRHGATIEGDGTGHVVAFNPVSGTVEGFVITGSDTGRAGVFTSQAKQIIKHNWITGNYYGIMISSGSSAWIEANHIVDNGPDFLQSGIRVMTGASGAIVNNFIAGSGVGIWGSSRHTGVFEIVNNTIVDIANFGMLLGLGYGGYELRNNIVTGSEYGIYAAGEYQLDRSGYVARFLDIDHNLLWNNSAFDYYAELVTYTPDAFSLAGDNSGPFDPQAGMNEVLDDPLLDPVTGYELSARSPAIDAGDNDFCPKTDLDGHLRPYDGDHPPDGVADCDIGAVEYLPEPTGAAVMLAGVALLGALDRRRALRVAAPRGRG